MVYYRLANDMISSCSLSFCGPKGAQRFFVSCGIINSYTSVDGFNWEVIQGSIDNAFSISYVPNWGFVAGRVGSYSLSTDGMNFVPGGTVVDTLTPFTSFECLGDKCLIVSSYDNSIFVSSQ